MIITRFIHKISIELFIEVKPDVLYNNSTDLNTKIVAKILRGFYNANNF